MISECSITNAMKLKLNMQMKSLIMALAVFGTAIGLSQTAEAGMRGHGEFHHDFDRDSSRDFDRDSSWESHRDYSWDHPFWRSHHFGYWHNHRGYWSYRDGQHVFIIVE